MSSNRTAKWAARTTPGAPPPPPTRMPSAPPPTIYPESSVSNPYASRYTGRPSRPSTSYHSHTRTQSAGAPSQHRSSYSLPPSSHRSSPHTVRDQPIRTFTAQTEQPIIARTSSANGRTSSYMIIPPQGQKVEIVHPTPVRSQSYHSPSHYTVASQKEKPLLKRLFGKVEWDGSASARSSPSHTVTRLRRHSTGSNRNSTIVTSSGTRITTGGNRAYQVHYV